jgi:hypothetical protein
MKDGVFMGQVNMSLSDETKATLQELQKHYHCSTLSEVVTRLTWEKKDLLSNGYDMNVTDAAAVVVLAKEMLADMEKAYASAFENDGVYLADEFERAVSRGEMDAETEQCVVVFGPVGEGDKGLGVYRIPAKALLSEAVTACPCDWRYKVGYWHIDTSIDSIIVRPLTQGRAKNRFGESMPPETGLTMLTMTGFSITVGNYTFMSVWNKDTKTFVHSYKTFK